MGHGGTYGCDSSLVFLVEVIDASVPETASGVTHGAVRHVPLLILPLLPAELENELGYHGQRNSMGIFDMSSDHSCNTVLLANSQMSYSELLGRIPTAQAFRRRCA